MTLFIIFHAIICVFLVCVILLQPGKSDGGIGFGSSSQSIFGSKGASNFLTKTTSICALVFLVTSFVLTRSRIREHSGSVIKSESAPTAPAVPAQPNAPIEAGEKLQDAIKGSGQSAPAQQQPAASAPAGTAPKK